MKSRFPVLLAEKGMREGRRITMRDAAKETGISAYTLTAMAGNTIKELPIDVLSKLCHYFECTPNDLFSMEEFEKYQEPEILAA